MIYVILSRWYSNTIWNPEWFSYFSRIELEVRVTTSAFRIPGTREVGIEALKEARIATAETRAGDKRKVCFRNENGTADWNFSRFGEHTRIKDNQLAVIYDQN